MIYMTGDCHGNFERFHKKERTKVGFGKKETDIVIVCGDFGLLWAKDQTFVYHLKWMEQLPFTLLWVPGNHENYDMIAEYPLEEWHGGKVRQVIRDKVIMLERGQIFNIEGKTFFAFGGASSHDIGGGILDKKSLTYETDRKKAVQSRKPFRIKHETWWPQELPSSEELKEGKRNLRRVNNQVDYVITHCGSNRMQEALGLYHIQTRQPVEWYKQNCLTDYLEELEETLQYQHWFCGHYHEEVQLDAKHTILYQSVIPIN
ncbi:MAG: metallophosphoesterase [Lachnospiraceae bacterium]